MTNHFKLICWVAQGELHMISEKEAQDLIETFIMLRDKSSSSKKEDDLKEFKKHEQKCMTKFKYLVDMRTSHYRNFSNFEDLQQEGFEALIKSMKTYNPKKGNFFFWAHKYIGTRVSRTANCHTTIKFPLKFAKANTPKRETSIPILIEQVHNPVDLYEAAESSFILNKALGDLSEKNHETVNMIFGLSYDREFSLAKTSKKMQVSRASCEKILKDSLNDLRDKISI